MNSILFYVMKTVWISYVIFSKVAANNADKTDTKCEIDRCRNLKTVNQNVKPVSMVTHSWMSSKDATDTVRNGKITNKNITKYFTGNSELPFLEIPKGDDMRIQELRLDEEYLIFGAFSILMGFLQPPGFPLDLLRETLNQRIPRYLLVLQVFKMDIIFVVWIIIWIVLSLCLPIATITQVFCHKDVQRLEEVSSIGPLRFVEKCTKRFLEYSLHVLLFLLIPTIVVILAANEQISKSITKFPLATNIFYEDVNAFVRNTQMQISFVVSSSFDIAIKGIKNDMEDVMDLLGRPYQQELAVEAGIDLALIKLDELRLITSKVTSSVSDVLLDCENAKNATNILREKLDEISHQINVAIQRCNSKDRNVCYTLQNTGFEVIFTVQNITDDPKIKHLNTLSREDAFNISIDKVRKNFDSIPEQIVLETTSYIKDARAILNRKRTRVNKSIQALDVLARSLSDMMSLNQKSISTAVHDIIKYDFWRWVTILGVTFSISVVWGVILCGAPCGCGVTSKTTTFLITGVGISSFAVLLTWAMGSFSALIGGHIKCLICNPLYDSPNYTVLGKLFDTEGILYKKSIFEDFTDNNDTIEVNNVLKHCQMDYTVYQTFHLNNTINIDEIVNYKQWEDLTVLFTNFTKGKCNLEILNPILQLNLQGLLNATTVNLTSYRMQTSSSITKKDLNTFADQLNHVARQITDAGSSRKIENVAFAIRKIIRNEMRNLLEIRNGILYKITALEVMMPSLNERVVDSLEHLKKVRTLFVKRLTRYLEDLFNYVRKKVTKEIGKCRPLWEIFHSIRFYVCKLIADPMNAIAFSSFFVIVIFLALAPVVLNIINHYKTSDCGSSSSSQSNGLLDEVNVWVSPVSGTPPEMQLVESVAPVPYETSTNATWRSPTLPRPPTISSRIQSIRIPQISTITKTSKMSAISSRISKTRGRRNYESLKLVEPIRWKTGSTTPKSWI
ncbi:prominin-1 isoform X2 [Diorhabda carinulata]|uniref:prominin-1 isoform X2 n=1 Tax=Diorhabda carinulata TaxID=1163345 RepID=UPI0025A204B5|nr:prominin-1 isoform X2 [Diorhabda carinulata]